MKFVNKTQKLKIKKKKKYSILNSILLLMLFSLIMKKEGLKFYILTDYCIEKLHNVHGYYSSYSLHNCILYSTVYY